MIPLKHSIANDMVPLVTRLLDGGSSTGAGGVAGGVPGAVDSTFRTALLADTRSNSLILRAANPARAQLVRTLVDKLDRPPIEGENGASGNVYVVYLKNADATKLATTLRAAMSNEARGISNTGGQTGGTGTGTSQNPQNNNNTGGQTSSAATAPLNNSNAISTGGQVQADPTTNSLIITAPEPQYRQMRAVIDRLDGRRAQVMVESLIIEVNADKAAEFGVQWQTAIGATGAVGNNSSLAGRNIFNLAAGTSSTGVAAQPSSGFNIGLGTTIGGVSALGLVARLLQSNGEGNVLSTPNLLTLDNEEAKIVIGQNVPFVTGQYTNTGSSSTAVSPFQTIERKDVGLTLRVRPQISENGTVKMQIFQEVSSVVQSTVNNVNGPTTSKRSIESNVLVNDGSIIVIGGLLQDQYSRSDEKVPVLGDVPVLGNLFKSEVRSRSKTNLMVFLRPVVMRDAAGSEAVAIDRYDSLRVLQQNSQPINDNPMLRNVSEAPVIPPITTTLPALLAVPPAADGSRRVVGTQLIPPPMIDSVPPAPPSPLKGALPPTGDPMSRREFVN